VTFGYGAFVDAGWHLGQHEDEIFGNTVLWDFLKRIPSKIKILDSNGPSLYSRAGKHIHDFPEKGKHIHDFPEKGNTFTTFQKGKHIHDFPEKGKHIHDFPERETHS
jgi:hypothetical protein